MNLVGMRPAGPSSSASFLFDGTVVPALPAAGQMECEVDTMLQKPEGANISAGSGNPSVEDGACSSAHSSGFVSV